MSNFNKFVFSTTGYLGDKVAAQSGGMAQVGNMPGGFYTIHVV